MSSQKSSNCSIPSGNLASNITKIRGEVPNITMSTPPPPPIKKGKANG